MVGCEPNSTVEMRQFKFLYRCLWRLTIMVPAHRCRSSQAKRHNYSTSFGEGWSLNKTPNVLLGGAGHFQLSNLLLFYYFSTDVEMDAVLYHCPIFIHDTEIWVARITSSPRLNVTSNTHTSQSTGPLIERWTTRNNVSNAYTNQRKHSENRWKTSAGLQTHDYTTYPRKRTRCVIHLEQ